MKRCIGVLLSVILGVCLLSGCAKEKQNQTPTTEYKMELSLQSDPAPVIPADGTYRLKYALTVGERKAIVPAAVDSGPFAGGTFDNVTNVYRPDRAGKALLRIECTYRGKTETKDVVVTVTPVTGGTTGGSGSTAAQAAKYPADPEFNRLQARPNDFKTWTEFGTHDPSLIQVDGTYYAFSTDVDSTTKGYQIRKSIDGIHWNYIGAAFADPVSDVPDAIGYLGLQDDFSFWAPDIVKGTDGKFWLYYSITSSFGSSKSYIGLAKAGNITGPYRHYGVVMVSTTRDGPNAIDPQVIIDQAGDYWLSYGSFAHGIYVLRLDKSTGLPVRTTAVLQEYKGGDRTIAGKTAAVPEGFVTANRDRVKAEGKTGLDGFFADANRTFMAGYYLANGGGTGMEGSVIAMHDDPVDGGKRYYMFVSYGDLTSTYNMRCFSSKNVYGPYTDSAGHQPYHVSPSANGENNSGNKVMGSFRFAMLDGSASNDFYAPGHNDLFTNDDGVPLVAYHCRCTQVGENMHYLYLNRYYFTKSGQLVMNPNRWAGETLRPVSQAELLGSAGDLADALRTEGYNGEYKMVAISKNSTAIVDSVLVRFKADGKIYALENGEKSGAETELGTFALGSADGYYIDVTLQDKRFEGVISPAWLTEQNLPGITITLLNTATGEALYFNMARK